MDNTSEVRAWLEMCRQKLTAEMAGKVIHFPDHDFVCPSEPWFTLEVTERGHVLMQKNG